MPGPAATPLPLSAHDAARELTRLAAACATGFGRFAAAAAPDAPVAPARRVALAAASRLLGDHAHAFAALVPESVLLASARAAGEADPMGLPEAPEALLAALDEAVAAVAARATPVADGALVRTAANVRADLARLARTLAADAPA